MASSINTETVIGALQNLEVREFGGETKPFADLSSTEKFLNWQFPDWKSNNETIMVPPAFTPSHLGHTVTKDGRYLHEDDVNIRGILGEKIVYERLQQNGKANKLGLFVIYDFEIGDIIKWNTKCGKDREEDQVPQIFNSPGQSDFIVFHHKKGVILIEVKNLKETENNEVQRTKTQAQNRSKAGPPASGEKEDAKLASSQNEQQGSSDKATRQTEKGSSNIDKVIEEAKDKQLERSRAIIRAFAKTRFDCEKVSDSEPFPVTMVIALPSTKKGTAHTHPDATLFLYEEDLGNLESFSKWWNQNIEQADSMGATEETSKAYELALSRILAVRHLGPVSESEYTAYASNTLATFKHLESVGKQFHTIKATEYPHLSCWCREMLQVIEHSNELPLRKAMRDEMFAVLKSLNICNEKENPIRKLNERLKHSGKRFLRGDEPSAEDTKVFQYLSQEYIVDMDTIVSYMNRVNENENPIRKLNERLELSGKRFLRGDEPSAEDTKVFQYLSQEYIEDMDMDTIVCYMNRVIEASKTPSAGMLAGYRTLTDFHLDSTDDVRSLNHLARHLVRNKSQFLEGECCTKQDKELCRNLAKGDIRVFPFPGNRRQLAPIFTFEQLAVFEGPKKQLIIGGPGSGKTELMRSKALLLSQQSKGKERILYLIQLPAKKAVFPKTMAQYFNKNRATNVDVMTIELEGEHSDVFEEQCTQIREELNKYSHVFIDELWIGSKVRFQMQKDTETIKVIDELKLVKHAIENVEGYVWMSSVFDCKEICFDVVKSEEEICQLLKEQRSQGEESPVYKVLGTPLLLETLRSEGGVVRRIKHLLRATNNIVRLLQDYSNCYSDRDFPYGTDKMLNHNVEGQAIDWVAVQTQSIRTISVDREDTTTHQPQVQVEEVIRLMYKECGNIIQQAIRSSSNLRPPSLIKSMAKNQMKLQLLPDDILVVNFLVRYESNNNLGNELIRRGIQVHDLTEPGAVSEVSHSKVCLLNSMSRDDSTLIDGTEWPMVIILLTRELLFTTAEKVPFKMLRNYDAYIAMFRAQAKLVVISESWRSSQDFLKVVKEKVK